MFQHGCEETDLSVGLGPEKTLNETKTLLINRIELQIRHLFII